MALLTEGFRIAKYEKKIQDLAYRLMRLYVAMTKGLGDSTFDSETGLDYCEVLFYLEDNLPPIEIRVYNDEDSNMSFDGYFDDEYEKKMHSTTVQGLIAVFFNTRVRKANDVLQNCIVYLRHELTHYLDHIQDMKLGKDSNKSYLDAPDDQNWLGRACYMLLNQTEWNAYQEEAYNDPQRLRYRVQQLQNDLNSIKDCQFDTPYLEQYARKILSTIFQKNYDNVPIETVKQKLVNTLEKKFKKFKVHARRKINQLSSSKQADNVENQYKALGKMLLSIPMGNYMSYEEIDYGNIMIFHGMIYYNGRRFNVNVTKNANKECYTWEFPELENDKFSEYDSDIFFALYENDEITDTDRITVGKKAYELMKRHNIVTESAKKSMLTQALNEAVNDGYNPRQTMPKVRGGWNKNKILRYLKSNSSLNGVTSAVKLIAEFDDIQELKSHIFWHGSQFSQTNLKPSITFPKNWDENLGGGGYGDRYWGISVTSNKRTATNFSLGRSVTVHPIVLAKDAKIIRREDLTDAVDLSGEDNEEIIKLYEQGVDAVYLGKEGQGEAELLVINPKAICNVDCPSVYQHYNLGSDDNPIAPQKTDEELQELLDFCKEWRNSHTKQPSKPIKPHAPYNTTSIYLQGQYAPARSFIDYQGKLKPREEIERWHPETLEHYDHFAKVYNEYQEAKRKYEEDSKAYDEQYKNYLNSPEYIEYQNKLNQLRKLLKSI